MLERALETDDDQIILSAYDPDLFDQGNELSAAARERIDLARRRVAWRADVRAALKAEMRALEDLFQQPPPLAIERLSAFQRRRTRRLIEQQRAIDGSGGSPSSKSRHRRGWAALNHVERVGARVTDRHTWSAIQGVVERHGSVEDILAAAKATDRYRSPGAAGSRGQDARGRA